MLFDLSLTAACWICLFGIGYRCFRMFRNPRWPKPERLPAADRWRSAVAGLIAYTRGKRFGALLRTAVLDGLFQLRIWKTDRWGWVMHICLFWGFVLLLLMHAFEDEITRPIFPDYASTLDPFLFLRNAFGVMVVIGVGVAAGRRLFLQGFRKVTGIGDWLPLALIALIIGSGFLLEGAKIVSEPIFNEMVEDYLGSDDPEDVAAVGAYWQKGFGVVFDKPADVANTPLLEAGEELHEESCAVCHSRPGSAFVSFPLSKGLQFAAKSLNRWRADVWLWHLHYLACFALLAVAPFGKMFHLVATPVTLLLERTRHLSDPTPPSAVNRRAAGIEGCTHCGVCSQHCSVAPAWRILGIQEILPSEKLVSLGKQNNARQPDAGAVALLADGNAVCTKCLRCTQLCPSGIDLQDLWIATAERTAAVGCPELPVRTACLTASQWAEQLEEAPGFAGQKTPSIPKYPFLEKPRTQLFHCVQCTTCTSVCPVVAAAGDSDIHLDVTPQQVMNLVRLGLRDLALGSRMVWDCVTCYQCQEHCPQGIAVTDILYELRNEAWSRIPSVEVLSSSPLPSPKGRP